MNYLAYFFYSQDILCKRAKTTLFKAWMLIRNCIIFKIERIVKPIKQNPETAEASTFLFHQIITIF